MTLLELDSEGEVVLKPWVKLIPEFKELFKQANGTVRFANPAGWKFIKYVYFLVDYTSPLRNWNVDQKEEEARRYAGLTKEEVEKNKHLKDAVQFYVTFQQNNCRPLRTFIAAQKGMDAMDDYLENVNFTEVDKQGKLKFTPNQFIDNLSKTNKAYDELYKLEKRVETELENSTGSRGNSTLGDKENAYATKAGTVSQETWDESGKHVENSQVTMSDFTTLLTEIDTQLTPKQED